MIATGQTFKNPVIRHSLSDQIKLTPSPAAPEKPVDLSASQKSASGRASGRIRKRQSAAPYHLAILLTVLVALTAFLVFFRSEITRTMIINPIFSAICGIAVCFSVAYFIYRLILLKKAEKWLYYCFSLQGGGEAPASLIGNQTYAFFENIHAVHERGASGAVREARLLLGEYRSALEPISGAVFLFGIFGMLYGLMKTADISGEYAYLSGGFAAPSAWRNHTIQLTHEMYSAFACGAAGTFCAGVIALINRRLERMHEKFYHTLSEAVSARLRIFYQNNKSSILFPAGKYPHIDLSKFPLRSR